MEGVVWFMDRDNNLEKIRDRFNSHLVELLILGLTIPGLYNNCGITFLLHSMWDNIPG